MLETSFSHLSIKQLALFEIIFGTPVKKERDENISLGSFWYTMIHSNVLNCFNTQMLHVSVFFFLDVFIFIF